MKFRRITDVFEVKDNVEHLLKYLTSYFYVFGIEEEESSKEFIILLDSKKLDLITLKDNKISIIKEEHFNIIREQYEYIKNKPEDNIQLLNFIDSVLCLGIKDIKITNSIFYTPLF